MFIIKSYLGSLYYYPLLVILKSPLCTVLDGKNGTYLSLMFTGTFCLPSIGISWKYKKQKMTLIIILDMLKII